MYFIENRQTDAAFNLALEEYALTRLDFPLIMLWRDADAVIIGKNQNAVEEVDVDYVRREGIAVIRRLSGGGAVFHDLGNVNFTMIQPFDRNDFNNYAKFTAPVCAYLQSLGVDARLEGRNDLVIEGRKFCGNAQAVKNGRILHHGCILYSADVSRLACALKPRAVKIESRASQSVRRRVTNIASHLAHPMPVEDFIDGLSGYFLTHVEGIRPYVLTAEDLAATRRLVQEKYARWDWNIGYSPDYNWQNARRFDFGVVEVRLWVEKGVIVQAHIFGDFFGLLDIAALEARLQGVRHEQSALKEAFADVELSSYIHGMGARQWLELLC